MFTRFEETLLIKQWRLLILVEGQVSFVLPEGRQRELDNQTVHSENIDHVISGAVSSLNYVKKKRYEGRQWKLGWVL